ncbi:MAG: ABC transporter permease subunit [Candidatus Chlorobium antarcticum]|jgi:ABC-type nitrate/sulfonate/bicarbonate transport system permease component|nr:ABC transporter permease subunit [Candidatus Chlorobium antarcticum]
MVLSRFYPPAIIPPVERIGSALQGIVQSDVFFADLFATLFRVIWSFIASLVIGVGLGLAAGVRKAFLGVLHPVMVLAESAPPVAWLVVAILLFGMGHAPSMLVGMSAAIPIFFFNTVSAVKSLDRNLLEMAGSYQVPWIRVFFSVYMPGILLHAVSASSSSLSVIWRVVIMAEAFTSARGFGPQLWGAYLYSDAEVVYAYIALIVMLGFILEFGLIKPVSGWLDVRTGGGGNE